MIQREKLIEIIGNAPASVDCIVAEADYLLANGVVVPPCKIGDHVFWIHGGTITECRVNRIQINRNGIFICLRSKKSHGAFCVDLCIGKTVFFTREEAEAALQKGRECNGTEKES